MNSREITVEKEQYCALLPALVRLIDGQALSPAGEVLMDIIKCMQNLGQDTSLLVMANATSSFDEMNLRTAKAYCRALISFTFRALRGEPESTLTINSSKKQPYAELLRILVHLIGESSPSGEVLKDVTQCVLNLDNDTQISLEDVDSLSNDMNIRAAIAYFRKLISATVQEIREAPSSAITTNSVNSTFELRHGYDSEQPYASSASSTRGSSLGTLSPLYLPEHIKEEEPYLEDVNQQRQRKRKDEHEEGQSSSKIIKQEIEHSIEEVHGYNESPSNRAPVELDSSLSQLTLPVAAPYVVLIGYALQGGVRMTHTNICEYIAKNVAHLVRHKRTHWPRMVADALKTSPYFRDMDGVWEVRPDMEDSIRRLTRDWDGRARLETSQMQNSNSVVHRAISRPRIIRGARH